MLETSQLLHYRVGEEFAAHCDFLDPRNPGHARDIAANGRKGDVLVFWNLTPDGEPDPRTRHIGTAPTRGEKWLFSQWIRIPATQSIA